MGTKQALAPESHYPILKFFLEPPHNYTRGRGAKLMELWLTLSTEDRCKLRLQICSEAFDKNKFGNAALRRGRCKRIGSGGHHTGQKPFQLWAVWA